MATVSVDICGVGTGHPYVNRLLRGKAGYRVKLENGTPMSIAGHYADTEMNVNCGYAIQVVEGPRGAELCAVYGSIGGAYRRSKLRDPSKFYTLITERFGFAGMSIGEIVAQRPQAVSSRYRIDYVEIPLVIDDGPKSVVLDPLVADLIDDLLPDRADDGTPILRSCMAPLLETIAKVKRAIYNTTLPHFKNGQMVTAPLADDDEVVEFYGTIIRAIPLESTNSVYKELRERALNVSTWKWLLSTLDKLETVARSIRDKNAGRREPGEPVANDGRWRDIAFPGVFLTGSSDQVVVSGTMARPCGLTTDVKREMSFLLQNDTYLRRYAGLRCDIVVGNDFDRAICEYYLRNGSRDSFLQFECFAIYPDSNEAKAARFAGKRSMLLIHGTKQDLVPSVLDTEMDANRSIGGLLGAKRIYMADTFEKAKYYANTVAGETGAYSYYFIAQCLIPELADIKIIDQQQQWTSTSPEPLVYADGSASMGMIYENAPKHMPQVVGLENILGLSPAGVGMFFGESSSAIVLPGDGQKRDGGFKLSHPNGFACGEYAFSNNADVMLRYLVRVKHDQ